MNLAAIMKYTFAALIITLLNLTGLVGHTSAMESMTHDMVNVDHSSSQTRPCDAICRSSVTAIQKNIVRKKQINKNNLETEPFYRQFQRQTLKIYEVKELVYVARTKPPPKIPIYILYDVFRA